MAAEDGKFAADYNFFYFFFDFQGNQRLIYEPVHEISNNLVCAISKASDQPAHTRFLIRAFASHLSIL